MAHMPLTNDNLMSEAGKLVTDAEERHISLSEMAIIFDTAAAFARSKQTSRACMIAMQAALRQG